MSDLTEKQRAAVGAKIKQRRKARNLTQARLAALINVERSLVAHWETGARTPTTSAHIDKLARELGLDYAEIRPDRYDPPKERSA